MKVFRLTKARRERWGDSLRELERLISYPLGSDRFTIDHGADYFAFFRRLGEEISYAAVEGDRIVAIGTGVLRSVPEGKRRTACWYLCDLKVAPAFRGRSLPLRLFKRAFLPNYLRCRRGYAISMNPGDKSPNRVVRLLERFPWTPLRMAGTLLFFSLEAKAMQTCIPILQRSRGPVSFLSLQRKKDLLLESTGRPFPLLHVQFGPFAEKQIDAPQPGCTHMFCVLDDDPLARELHAQGLEPSATASLLHHGMRGFDWRFILTSEI